MRIPRLLPAAALLLTTAAAAQFPKWPDPTRYQTYTAHRSSSREFTGANADARTVTRANAPRIATLEQWHPNPASTSQPVQAHANDQHASARHKFQP